MPCHVSALIHKHMILPIDLDCVCEEHVVPSVTPSMIIHVYMGYKYTLVLTGQAYREHAVPSVTP